VLILGAFTDFVYFDGGVLLTHKLLSTLHAPELAIPQGIEEIRLSPGGLQIIHGSMVNQCSAGSQGC